MDCYLADGHFPQLTREEELKWVRVMRHSPNPGRRREAKEVLIRSCIPLVLNQVSKVSPPHGVIDNDDLIQVAMIGLIRSVELFRPDEYGTRLTTYAIHSLWKRMVRERNQFSYAVALPQNLNNMSGGNRVLAEKIMNAAYLPINHRVELDCDKFMQIELVSPEEDQNEQDQLEEWRFLYQRAFDNLNPTQQQVMRMREAGYTLESIGVTIGKTRERVRQIIDKSIEIIREVSHATA